MALNLDLYLNLVYCEESFLKKINEDKQGVFWSAVYIQWDVTTPITYLKTNQEIVTMVICTPQSFFLKVHRHEILPPFFWHNLMSGMPMVVCVRFFENFFHSLKSYYKFKGTPRWPGQRRVSFFVKDRSKIKVYSDWCWAYYSVVEWIGS